MFNQHFFFSLLSLSFFLSFLAPSSTTDSSSFSINIFLDLKCRHRQETDRGRLWEDLGRWCVCVRAGFFHYHFEFHQNVEWTERASERDAGRRSREREKTIDNEWRTSSAPIGSRVQVYTLATHAHTYSFPCHHKPSRAERWSCKCYGNKKKEQLGRNHWNRFNFLYF